MSTLLLQQEREVAVKPFRETLEDMVSGYIFIAGPTCSGKTTLSHTLENYFWEKFHTVNIIKEDDYFKDIYDMPRNSKGYLTDSKEAFYLNELHDDVMKYIKNGRVELPMYDIAMNRRLGVKQYITKSNITIVEGLHTISLFYGLLDSVYIYMDTSLEVCLERRIRRDRTKYHIPEQKVRDHFYDCILPSYEKDIRPQREYDEVILYTTS